MSTTTRKTENVKELHSIFKSCLDILRNDPAHLVGDEALNEMSYFIILKLIDKHIESGNIDIYNLKYYPSVKQYGKPKFLENLEYLKFSKLLEYVKNPEKEQNIKEAFDNFIWREVLAHHPKFEGVFEVGKRTNIKSPTTIKKIVIALGEVDFDKFDHDILGEAYESIFVDAVFGAGGNKKSELGQFFTPPKVKTLLVKLVNPQIKEDGTIESVLDPACGTGGILNNVIKHYKQLADDGYIEREALQEQLIKNIYGIEIKNKIFNLCMSNMLVNTGEILPNVICSDSIRKYHNIKVDNIIANPPFSVSIEYDSIASGIGGETVLNDYVPIKVGGKNSEMLFLQMMIHCLKVGGKCATVMLDGQKMNGKTGGNDKVRQYLLKTCDLHQVIACPSNTFTSTNSKTCILFFTKKKERVDVLEIGTNAKRTLKFKDGYATKKVKFMEFNPDTCKVTEVCKVKMAEIEKNGFSFTGSEYIKRETQTYSSSVEVKTLEELFDILTSKFNSGVMDNNGEYDFYSGVASSPVGSHSEYNFDYPEYLAIIKGGGAGEGKYGDQIGLGKTFYLQGKKAISNGLYVLKPITLNNIKYLYYYLRFVKNNIMDLAKYATGLGNINKELMSTVQIPIPSIETQKAIVDFLDKQINEGLNFGGLIDHYNNINLFNALLSNKFPIFEMACIMYKQYLVEKQQIQFERERLQNYVRLIGLTAPTTKTLREVCTFSAKSKRQAAYGTQTGKYPFFTSSQECTKYCDKNDYDTASIIIGTGGSANIKFGTHFSCSADNYVLTTSNETTVKYLYYYLRNNLHLLQDGFDGAALQHISKSYIETIQIPIPSIDVQKRTVEYCEKIEEKIRRLEAEIEANTAEIAEHIRSVCVVPSTEHVEPTDETNQLDEDNPEESKEEPKHKETKDKTSKPRKTRTKESTSVDVNNTIDPEPEVTSVKPKRSRKKVVQKTPEELMLEYNDKISQLDIDEDTQFELIELLGNEQYAELDARIASY